jgi:acyl-CoA synthetase (AMP-forming)/AMP-acid ligase II
MSLHSPGINSLRNILQGSCAESPVAFCHQQQYSRTSFLAAVSALTTTLQQRAESRWLLVHDDTYYFAVGLLALLAAGKQVVLPPNARPGALAALHENADALLGDVVLGDVDTGFPSLAIQIDSGNDVGADNATRTLPLLDLDALTITALTSGSTGDAKAICKPLRVLDAEIAILEQEWGERIGDAAVLASVSHQHIYGLLFRLLWPLCTGRPFAAITDIYPEALMASLQQWPRAVFVSSPAQLKRFPPMISFADVREKVAMLFSSGGPLPLETAQDWHSRLGQYPVEVLGSTETGGVAWRCQQAANEPWQPFAGVCLRLGADNVVDEDLLFVHSPFTGENGWVAMGDRAQLQPNQRFVLLGRADTIVKVEEKRLSLTAMERVLDALPWIDESRIVVLSSTAASGAETAGRLGAVVVLNQVGTDCLAQHGKRALVDLLREKLLEQFDRVLLPRKWRFPDALARNAQGKAVWADLQILFSDASQVATPMPEYLVAIVESTDRSRIVQWYFPADASVFAGHFPDLPILPGVVQFDMAVRQCEPWYALNRFRRIDKLKFQEPVVPGDSVTLLLENQSNGVVAFSYRSGEQLLSSGRIVFDYD